MSACPCGCSYAGLTPDCLSPGHFVKWVELLVSELASFPPWVVPLASHFQMSHSIFQTLLSPYGWNHPVPHPLGEDIPVPSKWTISKEKTNKKKVNTNRVDLGVILQPPSGYIMGLCLVPHCFVRTFGFCRRAVRWNSLSIYTCLFRLQSTYFILSATDVPCTSVYLSHQMMNSVKGGIMSLDLCRAEIA